MVQAKTDPEAHALPLHLPSASHTTLQGKEFVQEGVATPAGWMEGTMKSLGEAEGSVVEKHQHSPGT